MWFADALIFSTTACYSKMPSLCLCRTTMRSELNVTDSSLASATPKSPAKAPLQGCHCQMRPFLVFLVGVVVVAPLTQPCCTAWVSLGSKPPALPLFPHTRSISAFTLDNPVIRELRRHKYNFKETRTSLDASDLRENLPPTQMLLKAG